MGLKERVPSFLRPAAKLTYNYLQLLYDRHIYERPRLKYRREVARATEFPNFLQYAEILCNEGGVVIPNYFSQNALSQMQSEFERLITTNQFDSQAASQNKIHIAKTRIRESDIFSRLALEPNFIAFAEYYWGKPIALHGGGGTRSEPANIPDSGSNQWHHDGKRKQLRFFVFLTDVDPDGQCTKFVPGSHLLFHKDLTNSRVKEDTALAFGKPVACAGPAGSLAILDTNAFHRATRNTTARRDIWNFSYRAPNPITTPLNPPPPLCPTVVQALDERQKKIARVG